jgi:hypothetical protein
LARRLREVREELYGEDGGPLLAERLRIPSRTLFNYESGVTVPAVVLLRFIKLTGVCPGWLMGDDGRKYAKCDDHDRIAARHGVGDPVVADLRDGRVGGEMM